MNFVAIDFETATSNRNSACSLAIVEVRDDEIVAEHDLLIQPPGNVYSPINISIHGIHPQDTEEAPTIRELHEEIFNLLDGANIVAHNASFDISVLRASCEYYGLPVPQAQAVFDTYRMTGKPLSVCCAEHGIDLSHHNALSDAHSCACLYMNLVSQGIEMPTPTRRIHTTIDLRRKALSDDEIQNCDTIFYGKNVVITGVFCKYDRAEIADSMQAFGANVKSSISKNVDIVICGAECGPAKLAKVKELKEKGIKDIAIIDEDFLIKILDS